MRFKTLLLCVLLGGACTGLPFPGFNGSSQTQAKQTETHSSSEEHTINGRPIASKDTDDDEAPAPKSKAKSSKKGGDSDIGKTCHKNDECSADACFTGAGNLGYCTKMCNSWSECPSHWECKKAGNAPQRICMQDLD